MNYSKDAFLQRLNQELKRISPDLQFLSEPDSGFYELCHTFLDIALNAIKFKDEEGKLQGSFQYKDIDKAQEATLEYVKLHNIKNTVSLLDIIEEMYPHAKSDNETRQTSGFDKSMDPRQPVGYFGTYYVFTDIPKDIFSKIKEQIFDAIKKMK